MRQEISHHVHHVDSGLLVRHGHVDVHAEDQQRPGQLLQLFNDVLIPLARRDHLVDPARKWMRAGSRNLQSRAFRRCHQFATRAVHLDAQLAHVLADIRPRLHDGLMHLALHLLDDAGRRRGDELSDVRAQFARGRINDLKLFFDADGKAVSHGVALRVAWVSLGTSEQVSYSATSRITPC